MLKIAVSFALASLVPVHAAQAGKGAGTDRAAPCHPEWGKSIACHVQKGGDERKEHAGQAAACHPESSKSIACTTANERRRSDHAEEQIRMGSESWR